MSVRTPFLEKSQLKGGIFKKKFSPSSSLTYIQYIFLPLAVWANKIVKNGEKVAIQEKGRLSVTTAKKRLSKEEASLPPPFFLFLVNLQLRPFSSSSLDIRCGESGRASQRTLNYFFFRGCGSQRRAREHRGPRRDTFLVDSLPFLGFLFL